MKYVNTVINNIVNTSLSVRTKKIKMKSLTKKIIR